MRDMLLVLNYNDEAARAITRKLRSMRICCKIADRGVTAREIGERQPLGLVIASDMACDDGTISLEAALFEQLGLPILALGESANAMLTLAGGHVGDRVIENAVNKVVYQPCTLLDGLDASEHLLRNVRDVRLTDSMTAICLCRDYVLGFAMEEHCLYGLQMPVEQNDPDLSAILNNFATLICGCTPWWDDEAYVNRAVSEIERVTGDGIAVCAMTGGLNSGVSALLAYKALGPRLRCIFIDTGLLRENEGDDLIKYYRDHIGVNIIRVRAEERFLEALRGVQNAADKNRVIGALIQEILDLEIAKIGDYAAIIRGTTQSDLMFRASHTQKPAALRGEAAIIEPVRELFKDEVRRVGDFLGLPNEIVSRQPFPGSGLALRIIGEVTVERLKILRAADSLFRAEIARSNVAKRLWQYFAVLTAMPGESGYVVCLRAVHASETSLAYAARLPYDILENVVTQITRSHPEINRVVYDLTPSNHYRGIEWQ